MFAKCKEAERRVKFKENRKRYREETEKCNQFPLNLKNKLKRKVKERNVKEGKKGEKRHIVLAC